jgi:dodecin
MPLLLRHHRFGSLSTVTFVFTRKERIMADSVYKIIELVGTSSESWEKAAAAAVEMAAKSLQDLRIAEVVELDMQIENGQILAYRTKVKLSVKYHDKDELS